jgi:hypothetical protein
VDKFKELKQSDQIIGVAGLLLFIFSFFDWFSISSGPFTYSDNGWSGTLGLLGIIVGLAAVVVVAIRGFGLAELPEKLGNFEWNQVVGVAAIVSGAFVILQVLVGDSYGGVDLDRSIGAWLGGLAALALIGGGLLGLGIIKKTASGGSTPPTA